MEYPSRTNSMNTPLFTIRLDPSLIVNGRIGTDTKPTKRTAGPYFNTTNETGSTLKAYNAKAAEQEDAILWIMQELRGASPSQVHAALGTKAPLTSIRRAMTNLTDAGKLVKMDQKVIGAFGRREHLWRVA